MWSQSLSFKLHSSAVPAPRISLLADARRHFHVSVPQLAKKSEPIKRKPKRLEAYLNVQQAIMERWLPAARGNLKRQRSGLGSKMWSKHHGRKQKLRSAVYATRSQLRKLKKIIPASYVTKKMGHRRLDW